MHFARSAFFVSLLTVAACSSSNDSSGTSGGFVSSYCSLVSPCCATIGRPSDGQACRAVISAFTGSAKYDANAGKACLDQMNAKSSDPQFCEAIFGSGPTTLTFPACDGVFSSSGGTVAPGGDCKQTSDCAPSTEGKVDCMFGSSGGASIKKCQVQIKGKAGDSPCVGTVDANLTSYSSSSDVPPRGYLCNIADGLYCSSSTKQCTQQSPVGGACTSSFGYECVADSYCDFTSKTCVARIPTGGACTSGESCVGDDYCDSTTKTCTAKLADGSACTDGLKCASGSCVNSKCEHVAGLGAAFLCGGS